MNTFLKPLTPEEEAYYIQRYQEGDISAQNVLVERNLRLVAHITKKYLNSGEDNEDLISIGTIGLIKAIRTFKPEKGNRLVTYAARCIDNELLMMLRSKRKNNLEVSLYESIGNDTEGNDIRLLDVIESNDPDVIEKITLLENTKKLYYYLNHVLSEREREILILRYGLYGNEEKTQKTIAEQLGISRSYVSRIEKKALQKMHSCFLKANSFQ